MKKDFSQLRISMEKEAIDALTKKPIITYSSERVRLWSAIAKEVAEIPSQPLKFGTALTRFLSQVSIPVKDTDILIGRMVEESFTPEQEDVFRKTYINEYLRKEGLPKFMIENGHQSFRWRDALNKGLPAMKKDAEKWLKIHESAGDTEKSNFVRGAIMIYDAIIGFINRCADAADKNGLRESAEACRKAASGAPDTFHSALQLVWSIEFIFCAYISHNPTLTIGRLDLFLNDIYEKDIASGNLDKDFARLLIDEFYAKNNLIMGRGEHQISSRNESETCTGFHRILAYDSPQYLIISGTDPDSEKPVANTLTELFIERIHPKYKNPVIVFRYTKDFAKNHSNIWKTLVSKMRDSASIMIYNDISVCPMYEKYGSSRYDALSHEYFGCNWPTIPGKDMTLYTAFHWKFERSLAPVLIQSLKEHTGDFSRQSLSSSIYSHFYETVRRECVSKLSKTNSPNPNDLRFYSCFAHKNMEMGGLYFDNVNLIVPFGGIATLIDIISAVDHLVNEKNIEPERVFSACDSNFENDPIIYALCKNAPKLGDDHETSSFWARELTKTIIKAFEDACKDIPDFYKLRFCAENDTWHLEKGEKLGATPDGRKALEPISQNSQPARGAAKNGITAMLSSLANIPFDHFASGALNVTVQPKNFEGENGLSNLSALISAYFEMGGLQIQLSSVDKELLLDAQKNPDAHRDLMVRVTGYSAVFVDMCQKAQDDLIARNTF